MDLCCLCCMWIHLGCVLEGKHWQSKDGKHCEFNMGNSRCTQPAGSHRILAWTTMWKRFPRLETDRFASGGGSIKAGDHRRHLTQFLYSFSAGSELLSPGAWICYALKPNLVSKDITRWPLNPISHKRGWGGVGIAQERQTAKEFQIAEFLCLRPPWRAASEIFSGPCGHGDEGTVFHHPLQWGLSSVGSASISCCALGSIPR